MSKQAKAKIAHQIQFLNTSIPILEKEIKENKGSWIAGERNAVLHERREQRKFLLSLIKEF